MRVGLTQAYQSQVNRMNDLQGSIDKLQAQIASGKRVLDPSDDPLGSNRVATLQRNLDDNQQYVRNMNSATTRLSLADSAVEGISNLMTRAQELAINATSGTLTDADRTNISSEVGQIIDQMYTLANSKDDSGQYLFAGAQTGTPAFAKDADGKIVWQGSGDPVAIPVGPNVKVPTSASGYQMTSISTADGRESMFTMLENFKAALDTGAGTTDTSQADFQTAMSTTLTGISTSVDKLADQRAVFGARMSQIDTETQRLGALGVTMQTAQSNIESLDVASAITQLQSTMTLLQASQQSFAQIKQLSLFKYLT